ncbi:hypothetical protein [Xanthomonas fragariae]|uniref:hypothetical protein n=1 Tax=Xanthomonas fragariae TaxID=48664 RepID=UPI001ABDFFC3|nr:hypothetical protein [Xanthomonas fragariae]UKR51845.1 hypothetical protein K4A87_14075 [Xanthomonas fragariae]
MESICCPHLDADQWDITVDKAPSAREIDKRSALPQPEATISSALAQYKSVICVDFRGRVISDAGVMHRLGNAVLSISPEAKSFRASVGAQRRWSVILATHRTAREVIYASYAIDVGDT